MIRNARVPTVLLAAVPLFLLAAFTAAAGAPPTITASQAASHVGELARVCGVVASAKFASSSNRQPTFLNLDRPYPTQIFTVLIWGSDRPAFGQPEVTYNGKRICVTGAIQLYKGKPEIITTKPSQIEIADGGVTN